MPSGGLFAQLIGCLIPSQWGGGRASGSRASLDCEWLSMFDFNLMKITAEQSQSGRTLSEVLDVAEARRIYLSDEWTHPFSLP